MSGQEETAPEGMGEFFDRRLEGYETHQLSCIEGAEEFYPFTAEQLPRSPGTRILDLGCGTGLELDWYFRLSQDAEVTGIDLAPGMLAALAAKFPDRRLRLRTGSYLEMPLESGYYDAAVSVESFHHYSIGEKRSLYRKIFAALRPGGALVVTDYFAASKAQARAFRAERQRLLEKAGLDEGALVHLDTPLTAEEELSAIADAGFVSARILRRWSATACIMAEKPRKEETS